MKRRKPRQPERSFILFAVMIIVMSALLIATSLLFMAQADLAGQADAGERTQSRLLAWSGVQAVINRLDTQRERILLGETPTLDGEYVLYETADRRGVVRLLSINAAGDTLAPEAAKLDLNAATAEMLESTGLVDATQARAIIRHRDGRLRGTFQSIAELLGVPGIAPEDVYGPIEDLTVMDEALGLRDDLVERVADRLEDSSPRGLFDLVTVYGFEPALQRDGRMRININVPWSEELGERIDDRFGEGSSAGLKRLFDTGTTFPTEAKIFQVLRVLNVEPKDWPDIIDALSANGEPYQFGRLDINTASYEALAALPGLEPEQATQIVRTRGSLSAQSKSTIAWPAIEEIVETSAYDELAGRITTRSWTYRMRLAAGEVDATAAAMSGDAERLLHPVIYEVVVDLSAPVARLAYIRDITSLQTAALIAVNMPGADLEEEEIVEETDDEIDAIDAIDAANEDESDDPSGGRRSPRSDSVARRSEPAATSSPPSRSSGSGATRAGSSPPRSTPRDSDPPDSSTPPRRRRVGRWQTGR